MNIFGKFDKPTNGCGVINAYRFHTGTNPSYIINNYSLGPFRTLEDGIKPKNNAGWLFCTFALNKNPISEADQKLAYEWFSDHLKLVYQSPVRVNRNTGNNFFFAVFDLRKRK